MEDSENLTSALNILRRVHPKYDKETINGLIKLAPALKDDIIRRSFQQFDVLYDLTKNKYFLACEFNQEEKNYRSPWSNKYFPSQNNSAYFPNEQLRILECELNELLELYLKNYYETGISSVYLWELTSKNGFAGCFCIKKEFDLQDCSYKGIWNSMHIIKVIRDSISVTYSLNSDLRIDIKRTNETNSLLSSKLSRSKDYVYETNIIQPENLDTHIMKIGEIINESETWFRKRIENIFIPKLNAVIIDTKPVF